MSSKVEAAIASRLALVREHVRDFLAAYVALIVLGLFLCLSYTTMSPCVRRGRAWAPTAATARAEQHFGFDQRCAAKQMFGMAEPAPGATTMTLIGQGIMVWFLSLIILIAVLVMAIASGCRNSVLRELQPRIA